MNVFLVFGEVLVLIGMFFYFFLVLGFIRMLDVYNRMQILMKSVIFGFFGVMVGVGFWVVGDGFLWFWFIKSVVIVFFFLLINLISVYVFIRVVYKSGILFWQGSVVDKYCEYLEVKEKVEIEVLKEGGEE